MRNEIRIEKKKQKEVKTKKMPIEKRKSHSKVISEVKK